MHINEAETRSSNRILSSVINEGCRKKYWRTWTAEMFAWILLFPNARNSNRKDIEQAQAKKRTSRLGKKFPNFQSSDVQVVADSDGTYIRLKLQRSHWSLFTSQASTTTMSTLSIHDIRAKYKRFRILVIGRANAGKTTLLQRVCNTTEDPCIYDKANKNLVSLHRREVEFCFWKVILAWTYLKGNPLATDIYYCVWPMQRGIHDIRRSFKFKSNPGFVFHDSPGFEAGDERQLQDVLSFLEEKAKSVKVKDQLHAIWSVSLSQLIHRPLIVNSTVKVLFCSEQCSAATPTGNEVFWDREGRKWYLLTHL